MLLAGQDKPLIPFAAKQEKNPQVCSSRSWFSSIET
jgi:hypothetical protein